MKSNKQKQPKPLTATQTKLMVGRMIQMYNNMVQPKAAAIIKRNAAIEKDQRLFLSGMLRRGGFPDSVLATLTERVHTSLSDADKKKITKLSMEEVPDAYNPDRWGAHNHPLHPVLEDFKFKAMMAGAEDYEATLAEFKRKVEGMLS